MQERDAKQQMLKGHEERRARARLVFAGLILALLFAAALNLALGSIKIELRDLPAVLFSDGGSEMARSIIWKIRLPRLLMAGILGGALATAGFLLQTFFMNPIAGPFVLGISSGAKMAVALVMILMTAGTGSADSRVLIAAAFAGSLMSTAFIIFISRYVRHMGSLLVAGMMIGYICSAATDFLITFAEDADIVNLHGWSQGSFSGMDWSGTRTAALIVAAVMILTVLLSKPIGAFQLGEAYARSVGVNVAQYRVILILLSSVLSACVTAYAGPVSFVGIAVPYLMRGLLKTSKPILLIPASFLGGAVFCLVSDLLARSAFAPAELNISTVTSLFGAPVVIFMLIRRRGGR